MQSLQPILESIGLNHHESIIYLHLLESGQNPASGVARTTKIPRSTTRGILDKLCERGIVTKIYQRNTQYYRCKNPDALVKMLEQKIERTEANKKQIKTALPFFEGLYQKKSVMPKVQFFEGPEQVIEAFNKCLYENIEELLIFTSYEFLKNPLIRKNDDDFFIKMRVKKGISARVLVGKTSERKKRIHHSKKEKRERRFIPEKYVLPGNIHIYGNSVMYFSAVKDEYIAILTESKIMADTMRTLFEFMWEKCKPKIINSKK